MTQIFIKFRPELQLRVMVDDKPIWGMTLFRLPMVARRETTRKVLLQCGTKPPVFANSKVIQW